MPVTQRDEPGGEDRAPGPGLPGGEEVPPEVRRWLAERRLIAGPDGDGGPADDRVGAPERALHELLAGQRAQLGALHRNLDALGDVLRLLPDLRQAGRETLEAEFYADRARLRSRMEDLDALCRNEILAMRSSFAAPEVLDAGLPEDLRMLERGVSMLLLVSTRAARLTGAARYLSVLLEHGARIRLATTVPLHLNVVDRAVTVLALGPARPRGEQAEDVILHGARLAGCFAQVFDHHWSTARPYEPHAAHGHGARPPAGAAEEWTPREREVLALLAAGAKDEAIARRLGCSERTLRRLLTGLVAKLGAESRFAAGVRAARLGLVD
ncbi:helix-turn-helix transcriptional regulator [Streptomyces sp. NPDC005805]|uniref:helix-turn-helix transcriptional regulator n=1 Tax=Streptomyces sp. NPDC005805 TaxID=3157068 RepID=UPI0033E8A499